MVTCKLEKRLGSTGCDRQRAEEGEGNINDGNNNKHVDGRVRGLHRADTGDGQWWRSRRK